MQELLKNSFILSISELLLKLAKLIAFVAIANIYGVEYLGIFNYIVSFLLIFSIIGELGINTYIVTVQSKAKIFPDYKILSIGIFKIFSVFIIFLLSFLIYLLIGKSNEFIFLLISLLIFSDTILTLVYAFYRAIEVFKYEFYFKTIQAFVYAFVSLFMYLYGDIEFVYFIAILSILNIILAFFCLRRLINFHIYIRESISYIKQNFMHHFKNILPIFLTTVFTTMYFRLDILMLESMAKIEDVGYYSVAYKLIEGAMVLPLMLGVVFLPKLSNNRRRIKQDIFIHFVLGFIIFILFYFTVSSVISILFYDNYILSVDIAKLLSYSIVIMSINTYMFTFFIATKNSYVNVKITFMMLILNLILNYIYIPLYGMRAAAITTVATEIFGMLVLIYYMRKNYVSR